MLKRIVCSAAVTLALATSVAGAAETALTTCYGSCRITYGGYLPDVKVVPFSSSGYTYEQAVREFYSNCQEYCSGSRDAISCTVVSGPSCH
jgi:hypothetical protein